MSRPTWAQLNTTVSLTSLARDASALMQDAATIADMDALGEIIEAALAMGTLVRSSEEWMGPALRYVVEAHDRLAKIAERAGVQL